MKRTVQQRLKRTVLATLAAAGFAATLAATPALADDDMYRVTITNLTGGQYLTPALVFSHQRGAMPFFAPGDMASPALEQLAEGGNTMPVLEQLAASGALVDYANVPGLIHPGGSASVMLMADDDGGLGLGAMLLPTNDGFIGGFNIPLPEDDEVTTMHMAAMDAGTETNDELCASIPGPPPCGGEAVSAAGGEGFVRIHNGIHGVGDLAPTDSDWRNPVARITVQKVNMP